MDQANERDNERLLQDEASKNLNSKLKRTDETCGEKVRSISSLQHDDRPPPRTKDTNYECEKCGKLFTCVLTLTSHLRKFHDTVMCKYPNCGKAYANEIMLRKHVKRLHDPSTNMMVPCPICNAMFKKTHIHKHMQNLHKKRKTYECEICKKTFLSIQTFQEHSKFLHLPDNDKPAFTCDTCNRSYLSERRLKIHISSMHENKQKYACTFCDKLFTYYGLLNIHLRSHTGERPFPCSVCELGFTTAKTRDTHVFKVHKTAQNQCNECGKSFALKGQLKTHMLIHKNEKNFKCSSCGKDFIRKGHLKRHMLGHSEQKREHQCDVCKKYFKTSRDLSLHSVIHSDIRSIYSCSECNKTFISKNGLHRHKFSHSNENYNCEICDAEFSSPINLKMHTKRMHTACELSFKCQFCAKRFKTKNGCTVHLRTHIKEKPFACSECPRTFILKKVLQNHYHRIHERRKESVNAGTKTSTQDQTSFFERLRKKFRCSPCVVVLEKLK